MQAKFHTFFIKNCSMRHLFLLFVCFIVAMPAFAQRKLPKGNKKETLAANKDSAAQRKTAIIALSDTLQLTQKTVSHKKSSDSASAHKPSLLRSIFRTKDMLPNPRTATVLSLVLPGAGQVYNGHWWKVPIVYGLLGGVGYLYKINNDTYQQLRAEFISRDVYKIKKYPQFSQLNNTAVMGYRNEYQGNVETAAVFFVLIYALNGVDAFVDAHLHTYDMKDDIGIRLRPQLQFSPNQSPVPSVGLTMQLR